MLFGSIRTIFSSTTASRTGAALQGMDTLRYTVLVANLAGELCATAV